MSTIALRGRGSNVFYDEKIQLAIEDSEWKQAVDAVARLMYPADEES